MNTNHIKPKQVIVIIIISIIFPFLNTLTSQRVINLSANIQDGIVGLDRKAFGGPYSQGYHHDFNLGSSVSSCEKIVSIALSISASGGTTPSIPANCVPVGPVYFNIYYGCIPYSGPASCADAMPPILAAPNFPYAPFGTPSYNQTYTCNNTNFDFGGNFSVDVVPVWNTFCTNGQDAINQGYVAFTGTITLTITTQLISCSGTGCLAPGSPVMLPCNDNNPCTINDMQGVLACDNSIVCIPCSGTPDPAGGLTVTATPTQPTCGLNNGSIAVSPGPGGYTYTWTGGLMGQNPMNVAPGTYTVTVTETSNGCTGTTSVTLNPSNALMVFPTIIQPSCGLNNGSIAVVPGPAGYTYSWTGGLPPVYNPMNVAPGNYTVTVTETSTGCTGTASATLNPSTGVTVSTVPTQPTCGQNNGSISVSPGPGGHTYVWTGGLFGQNPMNVGPGTYSVTVTETSSGCTGTTSVTLNPSSGVAVSSIPTQPSCGLDNGSIFVSPGPLGHTYNWTGGLFGQNPMNVAPGTYVVTVTETITGCTGTETIILNPSNGLTVSTTVTQPSCGQNNGSILVSPGPFGYTYTWTGGLFGQNPVNVAPGTYTVTVTETSSGCTGTETVMLDPSGNLIVTATPTQPSCGQNNGSILVTPGPVGHTYTWTGGLTGNNPMNVAPGTYTVTVTQTSNGCTGTTTVTLNASSNLAVIATPTQPSCGQNNGSILVTPGPVGHTYIWTGGLTGNNPMNVAPGTYTVTVTQTSNGCTGTTTVTLNASSNLTVVATPTQPSCGQNNGSILVTPGPAGHTYAWTGGLTGNNPMNVAPGTYTVTVTQTSSGCTGTTTATLNASSNLTVVATPTQPSCGQNNGSILVTPGPVGHTYAWTGGLMGNNPMNVVPGTYTVTVTQASNGCTGTATVTLDPSNNLTVVATSTQPSCGQNNGSILVTPGPLGHTYAWTGGLTGNNPMNVAPGTYTVTVTQTSNGCTGTAIVILIPSTNLLVATTILQPSCGQNDGTILVTPGPADHTYAWTGGLMGNNPMNVAPGTYTVTVTQTSNGCTGTATVTLNPSGNLSVVTTLTQPSCGQNNGSILVTPGPVGHTYAWTGGLTGNNPMNVAPGTYMVTVTQTSNGCTGTTTVTLNASSNLSVVTTLTQPSCGQNNGSILVTPGPAGHTYVWTGGLIGNNPMNVAPGTYTVTVTQTSNGCTGTATVTLNPSGNLSVVTTLTQPSCGQNNGSILVTPGPVGHTYAWTGGLTGNNPMNVAPGTYMVTVTQTSNGCTGTASVVMNISQSLSIACISTPVSGPNVTDGNIQITMSNGTSPYSVSWNGGNASNIVQNTYNISNLSSGNFNITVTDSKGCTATCQSSVLNADCKLEVDITTEEAKCFGSSDGKVNLTIKNAVGNPVIVWSNPAWNGLINITNAASNTYSVTITDNIGCVINKNIIVDQPAIINIACNGIAVSSKGKNDGIGNISVGGGTPNYALNWIGPINGQNLNNNPGTISIPNLEAGNYLLTVTDANNCNSTCTFIIEDKPCTLKVKSIVRNPSCHDKCDGEISLNIENAINKVAKIIWNNPIWNDNIKADLLCGGLYSVTVTDEVGCQDSLKNIKITQPDSIKVNISASPNTPFVNQEFTLKLNTNINPSEITSINWTNANVISCDNCLMPIGKISESTTFVATVISDKGCVGVGQITLNVKIENKIHFPNIISITSATNSLFFPWSIKENVKNVDVLSIYDRWGNLVFERENLEVNKSDEGWNGSFNSDKVAPGVYFYVSKVTFMDGEVKYFKGDITVIR